MIKSGVALSHDIVSATWLLGIDPLRELVQRIFPHQVVEEEIFAARVFGRAIFLPLALLPALAVSVFWVIVKLPGIPWRALTKRPALAWVAWLLTMGLVIARLNPASIEAWLMVLPPLFALFGMLVIQPAVHAGRTRLLYVALALLFAHNTVGGMAIMWRADGDFDYIKARWAIEHSRENDLIIVVDDAGFAEFLRYRTPSTVALIGAPYSPEIAAGLLNDAVEEISVWTFGRDFTGRSVSLMLKVTQESGGDLILFEDFFTWQTESQSRYPPQSAAQAALLEELREKMEQTYAVEPQGASYGLKSARLIKP